MELTDIEFVIELQTVYEVNKYLQNGWKIIKIYTKSSDPDLAPNDLSTHYALAATKDVDYSNELNQFKSKQAVFNNCVPS